MSLSPPPPTSNPNNKQHQVYLICYFCQLSQQQAHSDILIDTKCHLFNSCYKCYLENKHQSMIQCLCKMKLKDHVKYKNTRKQYILDQAIKIYEKQYKTRLTFDQLDPQLVQLMAYSFRHSKPNQFLSRERQLKTILKDLKKRQNIIFGDLKKLKIPQFVNRQNNDQTGKQACGYESNYEKGMMFLFNSFGI